MNDIAAIHREALEESWSGGSQAVVDEHYSDDYVFVGPLQEIHGKDGERARIAGVRSAFPDIRFTVHEQLVDGDRVCSRWTVAGTQEGQFGPVPPTGRRGEDVRGVSIARFEDGKLVSDWTMWDVFGLMQQLGAIPAPAGATA